MQRYSNPSHFANQMLGPQHCEVLPFFHQCLVSAKRLHGMLGMLILERWTVLMYSKNCDAELLNDAMKVMFTHNLKSLDSIPPTQHALFQHTKRALLAAAFIWKQSLSKIPKSPVIWAGNGTPGPISEYHSGQIWQMSVTHVHCSSIVVVSWPAAEGQL